MKCSNDEDRYRLVVEDLTEVISRFNADGTYSFVNEVYCRFFGKSSEELLGSRWQPVAYAEDIPMIEAKLATLSPDHPVVVVENRVYSGTGAVHWFQFVNRGFFDKKGHLIEVQAVGRDISALKQAEAALRSSEERLNIALNATQMGVWEWDVQTNAVYWSPQCLAMHGSANFDGTVNSFTRMVHPDDLPRVLAAIDRAFADHADFVAEYRMIRPDGLVRWVSDSGRPSYDASGKSLRLIGTVRDITDQKKTQEDLKRLHEKMSDLNAHLETVREQERLAISREIHDEVGQSLTALKLDLSWIQNRVAKPHPELKERLTEMRKGLDYLIAKAQHITAELRPPLLDNLGLVAAIEWQVRQFRKRSGLECRYLPPEGAHPLDEKTATAVMRIFQEAMTNILRHAHATLVEVSLYFGEGYLELEIADNGSGISPEEIGSTTAYGVMGMQERARLCQGELEITGRPGKGTTVTLTVPIDSVLVAENGG
ncbi:hypothetical protein GMLC_04540 [Geomonas limicola]|uniref:histidine kinase n=1 Tax=Geomonas limicola TaxID=2740186 RepID=A0A6V8N2U8_9BACT|nr:sensor histidine kinase [Geomonas limicola]GFO66875.1 hypothetical protein GMLC_04540 [Geomonas limicola]